jgi:predicted small metal-binding protein
MFRKELPRIYELRDQIKNPDSPNSCFQNLDNNLQDPSAMQAFRRIEDDLEGLDFAAWEFLKKEGSEYLTKWDEKSRRDGKPRGREPLLNIVYQAKAYNYLRKKGCSDIHFISRSKKNGIKTPDLQGRCGSVKVLCEVKTINRSEKEVRRHRCGHYLHNNSELEPAFFNKLKSRLKDAREQLEAYDPNNESRHMVYIVLTLDDFWGDYKEENFQQIDEYLSCTENRVTEIELVFHNLRTTFNNAISMKYATVVNEPDCR